MQGGSWTRRVSSLAGDPTRPSFLPVATVFSVTAEPPGPSRLTSQPARTVPPRGNPFTWKHPLLACAGPATRAPVSSSRLPAQQACSPAVQAPVRHGKAPSNSPNRLWLPRPDTSQAPSWPKRKSPVSARACHSRSTSPGAVATTTVAPVRPRAEVAAWDRPPEAEWAWAEHQAQAALLTAVMTDMALRSRMAAMAQSPARHCPSPSATQAPHR